MKGFSLAVPALGLIAICSSIAVAGVEVRAGGYGFNLPKTDVGHFEGGYAVPQLPFFMDHNLVMQIIARNTAGIEATIDAQIQIQ